MTDRKSPKINLDSGALLDSSKKSSGTLIDRASSQRFKVFRFFSKTYVNDRSLTISV